MDEAHSRDQGRMGLGLANTKRTDLLEGLNFELLCLATREQKSGPVQVGG